MKALFNDGWVFSEYEFDSSSMYKDGEPIYFTLDQFYDLGFSEMLLILIHLKLILLEMEFISVQFPKMKKNLR
jgi:hypothetical protein